MGVKVRVLPSYVVGNDTAVGTAVEGRTKRLKSFLPSGIPQHQRNWGLPIIQGSLFFHKIGTHRE